MKEIIIIWAAIILISISLLFPPFGYTKYTVTSTLIKEPGLPQAISHFVKPWTYVRHRFVFSRPPENDARLDKVFTAAEEKAITTVSVDDMQIGWPVIAVEDAVIILMAIGLIFTIRIQRRRVNT